MTDLSMLKKLMGPGDRAQVEFAEQIAITFEKAYARIRALEARVGELEQASAGRSSREAMKAIRERE